MYDVISIRRANPIEEVVISSGVQLRSAGQRLMGQCPFHRDGRPSLVVYPKNQSYFCFGCSAGGDVIDFVARVHNVGFKEAAAMLAGPSQEQQDCKPMPPKIVRLASRRPAEALTEAETAVIDAAVVFYHDALGRDRSALAYLEKRDIERHTASRCQLGFGCAGLVHYLRERDLSLAAAERVGLLSGERDTMLGRIVVPDLWAGKARWLTGRALGDSTPRYLNLTLPTPLLGLKAVHGDQVLVTEGPFDWLTAVQWDTPAVALLGTHVSRWLAQRLARFSRVYLALDADEAGRRAAGELMSVLGHRATAVELPPNVNDLSDLGHSPNGKELFQRCLELADRRKEDTWDIFDGTAGRRAA